MVKTRFAPSPTGDMHIGSLRTALYNYLFAKKNSGKFFLRIEDTDRARYQGGSVESILDGLSWARIKWDTFKSKIQNPKSKINSKSQIQNLKNKSTNQRINGSTMQDILFQSQRISIYQDYAQDLITKGDAYYCFCSPSDLDQMRQEQIKRGEAAKYDRRCLKLMQKQVQEKLDKVEPYVIRMRIPERTVDDKYKIIFNDLIRGQVEFNLKDLDDQILIKSDGFPTYHLANVVDDYEMRITHIIRAEEWLSSTPKHIILYNAFGWKLPEFAHLPLILAPDKSKLSKRHGATSVLEFRKLGYLPEALINYLALLGWNPGDDREIFTLESLEYEFSLDKVQKAGAVFDINKLDWMNGYYIRQLPLEKLAEMCMPYLVEAGLITGTLEHWNTGTQEQPPLLTQGVLTEGKKEEYVKKVIALEQERMKKLSEIAELTDYFFKDIDYETGLLRWKKSNLIDAENKLKFLISELEKVPKENWARTGLEQFIKELIAAHKLGTGETLWPMRVALTGRKDSPGPFEVAEVLGKEKSLRKIKRAVEKIKSV